MDHFALQEKFLASGLNQNWLKRNQDKEKNTKKFCFLKMLMELH